MGVDLVRYLQPPELIIKYVTLLLTLGRGHSFCPLLMCMSEAFSTSFTL